MVRISGCITWAIKIFSYKRSGGGVGFSFLFIADNQYLRAAEIKKIKYIEKGLKVELRQSKSCR